MRVARHRGTARLQALPPVVVRAALLALSCSVASIPGPGSGLRAQTARIQAGVDTTSTTVGGRIGLEISVEHPQGWRVLWPDSLDLAPFEVVNARIAPPSQQDDGVRSTLNLSLTVFELGELEIPSVEVEVVDPDGRSSLLGTSRFGIRVGSVGLDEGGDIREIRGPLTIPKDLLRLVILVIGLILGAILASALLRRLGRSGGDPEQDAPGLQTRPPHEVALEALADLERSSLLDRGEVKEYHIRVSEILRTYVEGRFCVQALELTTADITAGLGATGVEPLLLDGIGEFLNRCDMVKFAKDEPDAETSRAALALGRGWVEGTIPTVEAGL